MCVLVAQSCLTLCNPMDGSPPGSSVHAILQARILEWVAISFSRGPSWLRDLTRVSSISRIGRWLLYHWPTWKTQNVHCSVLSHLGPHWLYPTRLFCPWNFPDKITGVGSRFLFQGIKYRYKQHTISLEYINTMLYSNEGIWVRLKVRMDTLKVWTTYNSVGMFSLACILDPSCYCKALR